MSKESIIFDLVKNSINADIQKARLEGFLEVSVTDLVSKGIDFTMSEEAFLYFENPAKISDKLSRLISKGL